MPQEAVMPSRPRLGAVNAALVALYFAPVWGGDALRAMTSPFHGFEHPAHALAAGYLRERFDLGLAGLLNASDALAAAKFVIAAGFLAYLIDFARAVVVRRDVNRETLDIVLLLAASALGFWLWAAYASADAGLVRLHATQLLLLAGAVIVIIAERHAQETQAAHRNIGAQADGVGAAALP
jgi:hypothetical protein